MLAVDSAMNQAVLTLIAGACIAIGSAHAALPKKQPPPPMTQQAYEAAEKKIDADYEADRKLCAGVKPQLRDVCKAEAKGKADAAKAQLEAEYKPTPESIQEAKNAIADANYAVAKEKCALDKDTRSRCIKQAKLAREAAIRQAKVEKIQETGGPFRNGAAATKKAEKLAAASH
jgi:hypothetical protein